MSNNESTPAWRIILSACVTIFVFIRLAMTCSGMNSRSSNQNVSSSEMNNLQKTLEDSRQRAAEMRNNAWKNIFYTSYKKMDSLGSSINDMYGIKKLAQDSLIRIDIKSMIKIPKGSFYFNNYDENLRFAVKFSDGTNFLMHDAESKENVEEVFKTLKESDLSDLKTEKKTENLLTFFEYKLQKSPKNYNGVAAVSSSDGFVNFIEFESPDKSSEELKMEMTKFLLNNLVEK